MSANDMQVGGSHYKTASGQQHWDMVVEHNLNYFEGQITKYIMRCRKKNGKQDVEKALHFCQKYLEVYDQLPHMDASVRAIARLESSAEGDVKMVKVEEASWSQETKAREDYTIEGYKTDGRCLFKCKHCRAEGWGVLAINQPVRHSVSCVTMQPQQQQPAEQQ